MGANIYKIAAGVVLVSCLGIVATIISSVSSTEEKDESVAPTQLVVEEEKQAEDLMEEVERSKKEAAYRIEVRKRNREVENENNRPNRPSYIKRSPASASPTRTKLPERSDYEKRKNYINGKRKTLEDALRSTAKRQEEGGFPVDEDYIQNELDYFDSKYGKWN